MQTRSGEMLHKSRSESEGDEVSAIATYCGMNELMCGETIPSDTLKGVE